MKPQVFEVKCSKQITKFNANIDSFCQIVLSLNLIWNYTAFKNCLWFKLNDACHNLTVRVFVAAESVSSIVLSFSRKLDNGWLVSAVS